MGDFSAYIDLGRYFNFGIYWRNVEAWLTMGVELLKQEVETGKICEEIASIYTYHLKDQTKKKYYANEAIRLYQKDVEEGDFYALRDLGRIYEYYIEDKKKQESIIGWRIKKNMNIAERNLTN